MKENNVVIQILYFFKPKHGKDVKGCDMNA